MRIGIWEILDTLRGGNMDFAYCGSGAAEIDGFCSLKQPKRNALTWVKKLEQFDLTRLDREWNLLIVADRPVGIAVPDGYNVIQCENPKAAFFGILNRWFGTAPPAGAAATATVLTERIGKNVSIGHNCYIGPEVTLGDNVIIEHNVVLQNRVSVGDGTIIRSGTVIGVDGFGFFKTEDRTNIRAGHFGGVVIGRDVELGANNTVSRGTIDDTVIEDNVKTDNLCHIAHNAFVGRKSVLTAMSMLAGSCRLEENVYLGPGSLVMNQITLGKDSYLGLGAAAIRDVPENKVAAGVPARVLRENYK